MSHERGCETLLVFLARRRTVPKHLEPDRYLAVSAAPGPPTVGHRRHHPGLEIAARRGGSTRRTGVVEVHVRDRSAHDALVRRELDVYPASPAARPLIQDAVRDRFRNEQVEAERELLIEVATQVREGGSGRPGSIGVRGERGVKGRPAVPAHIHLPPPGRLPRPARLLSDL